jgi:hypothetical protein
MKKKVYLERSDILFSEFFIVGMLVLLFIALFILLEVKEITWRYDPMVLGGYALSGLLLIILIVRLNLFPYIFTRLFIEKDNLTIKRFNKKYVYKFADIKEIAALPKKEFLSKSKTIYFVISKRQGLAYEMKKIKSPSFVGESYFVISLNNLENIKPLLQYYRRNYEFLNIDAYKDSFMDYELEFLKNLNCLYCVKSLQK